jgi:hypothetical protein
MGAGVDDKHGDQLLPASLVDWELMAWSVNQRAPFSLLMEYALGLWTWTWRQDHPDTTERFEFQTPPLCLIALAGYQVAASRGTHDVHLAPLDPVIAVLSHDEQARSLVNLNPGYPGRGEGRLREGDRQALTEAVRPDSGLPWQQWREQAVHAVDGHLSRHVGTKFHERLTQVRGMRIRRGWYDHPELPPIHDPDAPDDERC